MGVILGGGGVCPPLPFPSGRTHCSSGPGFRVHDHSDSADLPALRTVTDAKAGRHQVGPQQTRSLSGDDCCDPRCHARITTQKITRLPIFPPDDRFPCCTKHRGLAADHVSKGPGRRTNSLASSVFQPCPPHNSLLTFATKCAKPNTLVKPGVSSDGGDSWQIRFRVFPT